MSQIPDEKLLHSIDRGTAQLTPDQAEALWNRPFVPADGSEWYLDGTAKKSSARKKKYWVSALAACLALCMISTLLFQVMPSASVFIDVNPSVELKVNYRNRVTKAIPCNADAEEILADLDFKGADLDVALYAILGSMVHHGYLTESKDTILISVHSANMNRASELEMEVTDMVSQSLNKMIQSGEILSQQINKKDIVQMEDDYDATPGKATFIDDLKEKYPQLEQENLDEMTVDEIVSLLERDGLDYSEYKEDKDEDEDEDVDEDDGEDLPDDSDEDDADEDDD